MSEPDPSSLMQLAIEQANRAAGLGEVPVGAVIVHDGTGEVIGVGHNRREVDHDPSAHAEIVALRQAARATGSWRLDECTMVVTLEPCPMCAGAIVNARIRRLIYGCNDPKAGAVRTLFQICDDPRLNHRVTITSGVRAEECARMLSDFFKKQRASGKK